MGLGEHVLGENDTWGSPEEVLAPLWRCFDGIDLDPCGNPGNVFARTTCMLDGYWKPGKKKDDAPTWIDYRVLPLVAPQWRVETAANDASNVIERDGLVLDWSGRGLVYVNPPFSDIEPWLVKAQSADECVLLMPARVNAGYLHREGFPYATAVCFPFRRVSFVGATTQPPWHTMLLYFGCRPTLFAHAFVDLGLTLPLARAAEFGGALAKLTRAA